MNKIVTLFRESSSARALIPIGLILLISGIVILFINTQNRNYIETTATITSVEIDNEETTDNEGNKVEATYKAKIKYTVDGKEYENELGGLSKRSEGQKMKIYYNPSNPSEITQTKSIILPIAIIAGGLVAFVAGIISGVNAIKRYQKMARQEEEWENGK